MSKPEDIPQDVWDAAEVVAKEATRDAMRDPLMPYFVTVSPYIARAILSAEKRGEEREREACAQVADAARVPYHGSSRGIANEQSSAIAAAIRKRGA